MDCRPIRSPRRLSGNRKDLRVRTGDNRTRCVEVDAADLPLVTSVAGIPNGIIDLLIVDRDPPETVIDRRHTGVTRIGCEGVEGRTRRRPTTGRNAINHTILHISGEELIKVGIVGDIADARA